MRQKREISHVGQKQPLNQQIWSKSYVFLRGTNTEKKEATIWNKCWANKTRKKFR